MPFEMSANGRERPLLRRPRPRRQLADAGDRMPVGNAGEHVAQPGFGIDAVELGGLDQRVDRGGALAALVRAGEGPILSSERDALQAVFGTVVIGLETAIVQKRVSAARRVTA